LDTVCYTCTSCNGKFAGYNDRSIEKDAKEIIGIFNLHVANGFAIDEELCCYILTHSTDSAASIRRPLSLMATDKWIYDSMFHCKAAQLGKVKNHRHNSLKRDHSQGTIRQFLCSKKVSAAKKKQHSLEKEIQRQKMDLKLLEARHHGDVELIDAFKLKKNRNHTNLPFEGIGKEKLLTCIRRFGHHDSQRTIGL